ncbi:hypothetical protein RJT34_03331 [Clitoria ternatea]|uniref:Uncharacterized protein n=1 Tax=Clitoria ternatea TaxID=43366 RepID=A0AAN9KM03_CLITE
MGTHFAVKNGEYAGNRLRKPKFEIFELAWNKAIPIPVRDENQRRNTLIHPSFTLAAQIERSEGSKHNHQLLAEVY